MIRKVAVTVTVAGANGSASGNTNTTSPVNGCLQAVYADPGSQPNTPSAVRPKLVKGGA